MAQTGAIGTLYKKAVPIDEQLEQELSSLLVRTVVCCLGGGGENGGGGGGLSSSSLLVPSPTLSPTDPVPRGLLTLCPRGQLWPTGSVGPGHRVGRRWCRDSVASCRLSLCLGENESEKAGGSESIDACMRQSFPVALLTSSMCPPRAPRTGGEIWGGAQGLGQQRQQWQQRGGF